MISPAGTFVAELDAAVANGLDPLLAASVSVAQGPAVVGVALYFMMRGMDMGLRGRPWNAPENILRILVLLALTVRIDLLNTWVRDLFYSGLPNVLMTGYAGRSGNVPIDTPTAAAAAFDAIWAQIAIIGAQAQRQSVLGALDINNVAIEACQLIAGFALMLQAVAYAVGKILLAVTVILSPYVFALSIHPFFEGLLQRWVGLCLAFAGMLAAVVIMLQISLSGDVTYLNRIIEAQRLYEQTSEGLRFWQFGQQVQAANAAAATSLQNMAGLALWMVAWAIATGSVGTVSFFLFGGIMPRTQPSAAHAAILAREVSRVFSFTRSQGPSGSSSPAASRPIYALSMPSRELPAPPRTAALPPPSPPHPLHDRNVP